MFHDFMSRNWHIVVVITVYTFIGVMLCAPFIEYFIPDATAAFLKMIK